MLSFNVNVRPELDTCPHCKLNFDDGCDCIPVRFTSDVFDKPVPLTATLLQRDILMENMAGMANAIIAGARQHSCGVYAEAAQRWATTMFNSPLHKKNLNFIYKDS